MTRYAAAMAAHAATAERIVSEVRACCPTCGQSMPGDADDHAGLMPKQAELLAFLRQSLRPGRVCPSYDEMAAALGLKSKSGIHRLVDGLEKRGYVRRLPGTARSLTLTRAARAA